jgi:hypothetical protein
MAAGGPAAQPGVVRRPTLTGKSPRVSRGKSASVGLRGGACYSIAFSAGQNQSSGSRFRCPGILPGCKATQALGPELAQVAQAQRAVPFSPSSGGDSGRVGPCLVSLPGNCLGRHRGGIGTRSGGTRGRRNDSCTRRIALTDTRCTFRRNAGNSVCHRCTAAKRPALVGWGLSARRRVCSAGDDRETAASGSPAKARTGLLRTRRDFATKAAPLSAWRPLRNSFSIRELCG